MALMTTSGSMPFSFASASIVCCNGFDMSSVFQLSARGFQLELHFKVRPCNQIQRYSMRPSIVGLDDHLRAVDAAETPLEKALTVHALAHHYFGATAREAAVVLGPAERPIQPGRRHFQRVCGRHDVLDVEDGAQIAADPGTVFDADALLGARGWPGAIDQHAQDHAGRLATELDVEDFQPETRRHADRRAPDLFNDRRFASH